MASGGPDQPGGSSSEEEVQPATLRVQKDFCIKKVHKLMKTVLPKGAKITKTSKQCMVECATEFISVVTSEAKYYCQLDQRNTITTEDLIDAMRKVGLNVIADYSFRYYQHYRNHDHACASSQYAPPPPSLPHDVHAHVSGQYYCPPPQPLPSQDVQARVSRQYYAPPPPPPPPPPLPLQGVQARNFPMAPNFMFPNPIETGTFFGGDYEEPLPPPLQQDVPARVSSQYYASPPPPPPLTLQNVQAHNISMAPNFMFPNTIGTGTFFGGDYEELLPPPLLQDVPACSSQYYAPPPPPPPPTLQNVQAHNISMAPNFMFPNPIEMGTFFGGDDGEELPPPLLPQDVQACVSGQYAPPPPPPQDVQARYFPMAPNFMLSNPIEMGSSFGDEDTEKVSPPLPLPQDVQARVSGHYTPSPPPLDVQARDFAMAPNFEFPNPIEMGAFFGDGDGEELPPPPLPQDVQARVNGQYAPPPPSPPPQDVPAHDFPMSPNSMFPDPMGSHFGDGNSYDEGFDLIAFLNSDD